MRKLIAVLLIALFAYDVTLDAFDADCRSPKASETCHACVCQVHAAGPDLTAGHSVVLNQPQLVPMSDIVLSERLFDKSFFHPPKTLA